MNYISIIKYNIPVRCTFFSSNNYLFTNIMVLRTLDLRYYYSSAISLMPAFSGTKIHLQID